MYHRTLIIITITLTIDRLTTERYRHSDLHGCEGVHVPVGVVAHLRPVVDDEDVHPGAVLETGQQLGRQQEVLGAGHVTRGPHQQLEHQSEYEDKL